MLDNWKPIETAPEEIGRQYLFTDGDICCPAEWTGKEFYIHNIICFRDADIRGTRWKWWIDLPHKTVIEDGSHE